jgi:hypothetical protein
MKYMTKEFETNDKNNKKNIFPFLYQNKDSLCSAHFNSDLPGVMQRDMSDIDQYPEQLNTDY